MRIKRAVDLQSRGVTVLHDMFSQARSYGARSGDMETKRREALKRLGVNKGPTWLRSYLDGWWCCRIDMAYQQDLVYGAFVDLGAKGPGEPVFVTTHRDRADYYERFELSPRVFAESVDGNKSVGHYWKPELFHDKRPRPFFVSAVDCHPVATIEAAAADAAAHLGVPFAESEAAAAVTEVLAEESRS